MHDANINGTTVNYWAYHDDKRPTIVPIHGFTGSHEGFQYLIPLLPEFRFIVPDLPGFGTSDLPPREDWSIDGIARLTNEFVASLELPEPPHILGHSMGGLVVSSMVSQQPDLYDQRMVLISPVPTHIRVADARRIGMIGGALQYRIGHKTGKVGEKLVKSRTISRALTRLMIHTDDPERRKEIYEHHFRNLEFISDIEFYDNVYTDTNRLGSIHYADALAQKDVLLIAGNKDSVTPLKEMTKLARRIQPEVFEVIPNVGHLIHYEKAAEAATAIRAFLSHRQ